jgi:pyridoxal phosphate enzyme (YggS family)
MPASIADNLRAVRARIADACARAGREPADVAILAVTKTHPVTVMLAAAAAGLSDLGENRVQEALPKVEALRELASRAGAAPPPRVHLIGRLQSNKVNKAVGVFDSIATLDAPELLDRVAARAAALGSTQRVWLQVNVSSEPQKGGCAPARTRELWARAAAAPSLRPVGLMMIGRLGSAEAEVRAEFADLRELAAGLARSDGRRVELSMGMSDDFEWAVLEGSTQVRLGSVLFGPRLLQMQDS